MENKPFFSVVIPLYNKEKYILATITSVLNQTFTNYEIIIINDGSTDNSLEIINKMKNEKMKIFSIKNKGVSHARNFGIKNAEGKYIAFLDADDIWIKNKLEEQFKLLNNSNLVWCTGRYIKDTGEEVNYKTENTIIDDTLIALNKNLSLLTSTLIVKREIFSSNIFLFDEKYSRSEDIEVWYKLALAYPNIGYVNSINLLEYTTSDVNSLTNTTFIKQDYSLLLLKNRIEKINGFEKRKKILNIFLDKISKKTILQGWYWSFDFHNDYNDNKKLFLKYLTQNEMKILIKTSKSNSYIKKIFYKLFKIYLKTR
jgi:glycosyltransferase involved in cell wall biosynthesis